MKQVNYWSYILHSSNTWEKREYNEAVHQLFIDFKKTSDSVRREVLHNVFWVCYPQKTGKANKNVSDWTT